MKNTSFVNLAKDIIRKILDDTPMTELELARLVQCSPVYIDYVLKSRVQVSLEFIDRLIEAGKVKATMTLVIDKGTHNDSVQQDTPSSDT